jgi:hypothetical protein
MEEMGRDLKAAKARVAELEQAQANSDQRTVSHDHYKLIAEGHRCKCGCCESVCAICGEPFPHLGRD